MKDRRPGRSSRTFWMDDDLHVEIQKLAKSENCSMTDLIDRAMRALIVATLHEVLRNQYVVLNTAVESGSPTEKVDKWREDGWNFARSQVKEHRDWIRGVLERED